MIKSILQLVESADIHHSAAVARVAETGTKAWLFNPWTGQLRSNARTHRFGNVRCS
jgi:hypothetical protein